MNSTKSQDFLNSIKELHKDDFKFKDESLDDAELREILKKSKDKIYITPDLLNFYDYQHLDKIIASNVKDLLKRLPTKYSKEIKKKVAIGGLEIKHINAAIIKNTDSDEFAILINYGLVIYILKFFSYIFAATDLENVIWCDRIPINKITKLDLMKFADELALNYVQTGLPFGPRLLLNRVVVDDITHFSDLSIQFVICHELGHYFNGDCNHESNFSGFDLSHKAKILNEEINHEAEILADLKGFDLLKKIHTNLDLNLHGLYLFFIAMDWLYKKPTGNSHPNPIKRYMKIIKSNYDEATINEFSKFLEAFTIKE